MPKQIVVSKLGSADVLEYQEYNLPSILKNKKEFDSLPIVSSGRMPPDLEKILSLKPDLVVGAKGFHDRPLSKLNSLGISTLSTSISNLDDLDIFH